MGRIIPFQLDRHQLTQTLLPWYVNGRLDGEDLAAVEEHLNDCAECRAELRLERRLERAVAELPVDVEQGWTALREQMVRRRGGALSAAARRVFGGEAAWGWAVAAQILLVVTVVALSSPAARPPEYRALGSPRAAPPGDVIVIFRPDATEQDLRGTLRAAGARLVDGPTASDAYVLSVPLAQRPAALARLAAAPQVVLAQPIDAAEGP